MTKETATDPTNTIVLNKNGMATPIEFNIDTLSDEIKMKLVEFGLQEKTSNALASAKKSEWSGEERTKRVQTMIDALLKGEWSTRVAGASGLSPLDAEIARLAYEQAKAIVGSQCTKPEDGFPRAKTAWLDGTYVVTESGETTTGNAVLDLVTSNKDLMARITSLATENVAKKEAEAKAREGVAISL